MRVRIDGDTVVGVELEIYEPPRFFEAPARRGFEEPPDITARICGICRGIPDVVGAGDRAVCGVTVDGQLAALRRLLYCGEWIESHALHIYLLHAPDFLGYDGGISMRATTATSSSAACGSSRSATGSWRWWAVAPCTRERARRRLLVAARPRRAARARARPAVGVRCSPRHGVVGRGLRHPEHHGEWALVSSRATASTRSWAAASSRRPRRTSCHRGVLRPRGRGARGALQRAARLVDSRTYLVGPLARYSLNHHLLPRWPARPLLQQGSASECRNPFASIVVRAVELLTACEEALRIVREYVPPPAPAVPVSPRAGVGHGASEAPRGLLYHRYEVGDDGLIRSATIRAADVAEPARDRARPVAGGAGRHPPRRRRAARPVRAVHPELRPCISCATHAYGVAIDRRRLERLPDLTPVFSSRDLGRVLVIEHGKPALDKITRVPWSHEGDSGGAWVGAALVLAVSGACGCWCSALVAPALQRRVGLGDDGRGRHGDDVDDVEHATLGR